MRVKSHAIGIPNEGSPAPEEVELGRRRYPLAECHITARFRRKDEDTIEMLYVEEWSGPLWPLWLMVDEIAWTARWIWSQILRLTACKIFGHDAVSVDCEFFIARICARCKEVLEPA